MHGFLKTKNGLFPAPLPPGWLPQSDMPAGSTAAIFSRSAQGKRCAKVCDDTGVDKEGSCDEDEDEEDVSYYASAQCDAAAPLLARQFRLLGRLFGKALMDEYVFPLALHPAFFSVVRGDALAAERYFGVGLLNFDASHMFGARGEPLGRLFAVKAALEELERGVLTQDQVFGRSYAGSRPMT